MPQERLGVGVLSPEDRILEDGQSKRYRTFGKFPTLGRQETLPA
jgi:hypothetical protein